MRRYQLQAEQLALEIQKRNFPDTVALLKAGLEAAYNDGYHAGTVHVCDMSLGELVEIRRVHKLAMASSE